MEWQPIETAPKDGTEFLAFGPHADDFVVLSKHGELLRDPLHGEIFAGDHPTHWMTLPPPPYT